MRSTVTGETERTSIKAYVPAYQKEAWRDHADELGMSLSEFVATMVQAGRSDLDPGAGSTGSGGVDPGGQALEDLILDALGSGGPLSWDELVARVSEDVESRLETAVSDLQAENRVRHDPRKGGYVRVEDGGE